MPSRDAIRPEIWLNGEYDPHSELEYCERSAGGDKLDYAVIRFDLARRGNRLADRLIGGELDFECEIFATARSNRLVLHWGVVEQVEPNINPNDETIRLVSRISNRHFGRPIWGQRHYNPQTAQVPLLDQPIVFNPIVNARPYPNMRGTPLSPLGSPLFLAPEVARTQAGAAYHDTSERVPWTLAGAVSYLCAECNFDQRRIYNPTLSELTAFVSQYVSDSGQLLRNVHLNNGLYLPEALTQILEPFGFGWYVKLLGPGQRKIELFRAGEGRPRTVLLQSIGSVLDVDQSEVEILDVVASNGERINQARGVGGKKVIEATFELVPAWSQAVDFSDPYSLPEKDSEEWFEQPETHRVWRDWVLNEAGDYNGSRPTVSQPPDLSVLLQYGGAETRNPETGQVLPRRRKFLPMLTLGDDDKPLGSHHGCVVEFFDPGYAGGGQWVPVYQGEEDWTVKLLENECGIRFDGSVPPVELYEIFQDTEAMPRLRITAAIEIDTPLECLAPNPGARETTELLLDVEQRYVQRYYFTEAAGTDPQLSPSAYPGILSATGTFRTSAVDDSEALLSFVTAVRAAWDQQDIAGALVLEGFDQLNPYEIGDLVTRVEGRELRFQADEYGDRFPQIYAIKFDAQAQRVTLTLNTFREIDAYIGNVLGDKRQRRARHELD